MQRCEWATNDLAIRYHDEEWGVPVHDDRLWFEFLVLEGAQAGLNWDTILKRREGYRTAFDGFDPVAVARYEERMVIVGASLFPSGSSPGSPRGQRHIEIVGTLPGAFRELKLGYVDAYVMVRELD